MWLIALYFVPIFLLRCLSYLNSWNGSPLNKVPLYILFDMIKSTLGLEVAFQVTQYIFLLDYAIRGISKGTFNWAGWSVTESPGTGGLSTCWEGSSGETGNIHLCEIFSCNFVGIDLCQPSVDSYILFSLGFEKSFRQICLHNCIY